MPGKFGTPSLPFLIFLSLVALSYATPNAPECPPADEIVYSPFRPYWEFYPGQSNQKCWDYSSCVSKEADEARKAQFAAVALVMGLIPLTFHDIAWPERRVIPVSRRQGFILETVVRATGLVPVVSTAAQLVESATTSSMVRWARGQRKPTVTFLALLSLLAVLVTYAGLALTEIYSKRVALGCPFPVFILTWHLVAILPAAIHAGLSRFRERYYAYVTSRIPLPAGLEKAVNQDDREESKPPARDPAASPVQGADEWWVVQLCWAIYHIAGTLIYSSVMSVTVLELLVWVVTSFAAAWSSKLLGFFITLAFEENIWVQGSD